MNTQMPKIRTVKEEPITSRRNFLELAGKFSFFAAFAGIFTSTMRFFLPNVLYEPPTSFLIGSKDDYPADSITFLEENRLFVFHVPAGLYAISSTCTHLGCNVNWNESRKGFDCPCHGSTFDQNGLNIGGPAPKPLQWYKLTMNQKDQLIVHTLKEVDKNFRFKV